MDLTRIQLLMLSELRHNSRQKVSELTNKLNISKSSAHFNYKKINQFITQNSTQVNFDELGYSLRINFIFNVKSADDAKQLFIGNKNIDSITRINTKKTFMIGCFFRRISEAYEFKEMLHDLGIEKVQMIYLIEEIKKEECYKNGSP